MLQEIGSRRALHQGWTGPLRNLPHLVVCLSTKLIYISIYIHLLIVTTTRKSAFRYWQLTELKLNEICRTFFYLSRILSMYHSITSPPLGSDLFFPFLPKIFKLFKGLFIILPELLQIPFVLSFLRKESQLGRNQIYQETFEFWAWHFPLAETQRRQ